MRRFLISIFGFFFFGFLGGLFVGGLCWGGWGGVGFFFVVLGFFFFFLGFVWGGGGVLGAVLYSGVFHPRRWSPSRKRFSMCVATPPPKWFSDLVANFRCFLGCCRPRSPERVFLHGRSDPVSRAPAFSPFFRKLLVLRSPPRTFSTPPFLIFFSNPRISCRSPSCCAFHILSFRSASLSEHPRPSHLLL